MKLGKKGMATLGLVFITFLAAIQYVFLINVPDSVSTFSFVCITNIIGMVILFAAKAKRILKVKKKTLAKGAFFALLLTGFNVFILLGSRGMESVAISSVVSLYFVFITPMLLLLRKKVNFFSGIATAMAIIALLLMFGGVADISLKSTSIIYLIFADVFFAAYVVGVSILGEGEDNAALTFSQMAFAAIFSLIGWLIEVAVGNAKFAFPTQWRFWVSALFIGIFIRTIYGLVQIACQKEVSAIATSLIFSMEIIITMIMDPFLSRILGTQHTPASPYQIIGALLLIIATLTVDDTIMSKLGYADMNEHTVSKKMVVNTITFSMVTLVFSTIISFYAIYMIRGSAVNGSTKLGEDASKISTVAMTSELERNALRQTQDKTKLAEAKLATYSASIDYAASYADTLFEKAEEFPKHPAEYAKMENAGIWAMQLELANPGVAYEDVLEENEILGNMEDIFEAIIKENENVLTIYLGTEKGLLISYDEYSQLVAGEGNQYYEYRNSVWYKLGKSSKRSVFTDTYWDGYGRGLTITCVAPFFGKDGEFVGCVAMDVLMTDLNASMVNDGIVEPNVATMIDDEGNVIADGKLDPNAQETFNIFDNNYETILKSVGRQILAQNDGILKTGEGDDAVYVAYATIDSTNWKLCLMSPVSNVIKPAQGIRTSIDKNTDNVVQSVIQGVLNVLQSVLVLTAVLLLLITLTAGYFSRKIANPLKRLTSDVEEITGGNFQRRSEVDTDDEIGELARSFNSMTDSLEKYIADLKEATAKEERIVGELAAATNIQASMLPRDFEEFSKRKEFDLYATMTPAKEVGGDFYDYFMVDDDHVALVMADVSGKGVPAALFMVIAKTLIKSHLQNGESPADALTHVNEQLCEGNEEQLFVTVWLAVIELSTGKGVAANAGHEHPTLKKADGTYELVTYRHSPAVATMEGLRFKEHEFELQPGDRLFVYTDGVPEATNASEELMGPDRMLEALNGNASDKPEDLLRAVREGIDAFVGDAPQFDDITMMGFFYYGSKGQA